VFPASGSDARRLERGSDPSSAVVDRRSRRCILNGVGVRVCCMYTNVLWNSDSKCMYDANDVWIVLPRCLDRTRMARCDDWTCDQAGGRSVGSRVTADSLCSQSRRIWRSIRPDSESSGAAAWDGMHCNQMQIHDFQPCGDVEAVEAIRMRGVHGVPVPHNVHPTLSMSPLQRKSPLARPPLALPSHATHSPTPPQGQSTPLHAAAASGQEAVCRVLVEAGAKVDA